jgi:hypothetical protein
MHENQRGTPPPNPMADACTDAISWSVLIFGLYNDPCSYAAVQHKSIHEI